MKFTGNIMQERLQKIISSCGYTSRRSAEKLIEDGRVKVNGEIASIGDRADLDCDSIEIDGIRLVFQPERVYVAVNKPKGYVTTLSDEKGRKNVSELVSEIGIRLYPVGRLDINSEGLLLMTNDGDFANRLMHPSGNILKTYRVWVRGFSIDDSVSSLSMPLEIEGGCFVKAKKVSVLKANADSAVIDITIGEGKNRQVRKMCDKCSLTVTRLCRMKEGPVSLGNLKSGMWRYLSESELNDIKKEFNDK